MTEKGEVVEEKEGRTNISIYMLCGVSGVKSESERDCDPCV